MEELQLITREARVPMKETLLEWDSAVNSALSMDPGRKGSGAITATPSGG